MKYKILSVFVFFVLVINANQAQTKIGQLAPCKDAQGNALAGCQIVSGADGKYKQVVFAACECDDGDVIKKYTLASNPLDTCHIEIIPGLCNMEQVVVVPLDADGDGVNAGTDPDDTNPCVPSDVVTVCDTDGDGIPDGNDNTNGDCALNGACDDGDASTTGETYDANCNCGGGTSTLDSDGDGTLDVNDSAPNDPCIPSNTVSACDTDGDGIPDGNDNTNGDCTLNGSCDDGDANTTGETYDANCNCVGGTAVATCYEVVVLVSNTATPTETYCTYVTFDTPSSEAFALTLHQNKYDFTTPYLINDSSGSYVLNEVGIASEIGGFLSTEGITFSNIFFNSLVPSANHVQICIENSSFDFNTETNFDNNLIQNFNNTGLTTTRGFNRRTFYSQYSGVCFALQSDDSYLGENGATYLNEAALLAANANAVADACCP